MRLLLLNVPLSLFTVIIDLLIRFIAGNENEMSFFTSWSRCPPLGHYWFLVDAVIFRKTGFDLNLRILRSREDEEKSMTRICPKCNHNLDSSPDASNSSDDTMNISDIAASLQVRKFSPKSQSAQGQLCSNFLCYAVGRQCNESCATKSQNESRF